MRRLVALAVLVTSVLCTVVGTLSLLPGAADADLFGPITLASQSAIPGFPHNQQVDYAHDPAISGNGRYVVFDGSFGGVTGVWRRDLATGAVEPVAVGAAETPAGSAKLPSI